MKRGLEDEDNQEIPKIVCTKLQRFEKRFPEGRADVAITLLTQARTLNIYSPSKYDLRDTKNTQKAIF